MIFITSDNVRINYEINGTGTTLIMLNGLWGDTSSWEKQVAYFSDTYQCIRMDHRGMAKSDKWIGEYSYDLHARDVFELLTHLGINKCHLLGVCHGGMTAVTFAKKYPQKTLSVIINGTQILTSTKQQQLFSGWKTIIEQAGFSSFYKSMVIPAIFSESFLSHNADRIDDIVNATLSRIEKISALKLVDACYKYGFEAADVADIETPALMMSGDEDCFISRNVIESYGKVWKNFTYYNFKNCGHFPQREAADEYNRVVKHYLSIVSGEAK